jgi:hypothetical protein
MATYDAEVAEIDAFLATAKTLAASHPTWTKGYGRRWGARWAILDEHEIQRGELAFEADATLTKVSISVITQRRPIYRVDLVPASECKKNPISAAILGLPAEVCGSHFHAWADNRERVRMSGEKELPYRRPTPTGLKNLSQALAAVAQAINLDLTSDQRGFDLPSEREIPF